jgi:8-oxo-dGTP pyrophosphatase MutT (NUDIX family)
MDEIVALYDEGGRPVGAAPRSRVRADNLRHAATAVVVRDLLGRVFMHRRTDTKDVYPGRWDFAAGGVLLAGEDPDDAARREAEEELGVTSPLVSLGEGDYADDHTTYHGFLYETFWDGPLRLQAEEVAEGSWVTLEALAVMLADPDTPVMPDTVGLLGWWVHARLADRSSPPQGWDSVAEIVEGRWLDRRPARPEVARRLLAESRLLPALAPKLGLTVPVPRVLDEHPLRLRHVLVPGVPCEPERLTAADGAAVGGFLRRLHDTRAGVYDGTGVLGAADARAELVEGLAGMRARVLPLLPADRRADGEALLDAVAEPTTACLVHGDLGPDHVYVTGGRVSGVIDWTDARIADPALDLAWTLHGTPSVFADALAAAYGVTGGQRARGLDWHRLGPWWEALAGVDFLSQETVLSGLAGIRERG